MSINTYFRPNIHQNNPEILGVINGDKIPKKIVILIIVNSISS
jgi:hypothetical protein